MEPEKETKQKSEQKIDTSAKSLRTYQGDVEEAVSKNHYSTSKIFVAEQKKKIEAMPSVEIPRDTGARNKLFIIIGATLLVLGIIIIGTMYYIKSRNEVVIQQKTSALIGYSEEKILPTTNSTKEKLIKDILAEQQSFNLPVNSVLYINTVNSSSTPTEIENILSLIAPQMPSSLSRSFSKEYMIGMYSSGANEPFIILTTNDFASSFSGMLKWEKYMSSDLGKLFSLTQNTGSTTIEFKDEALHNKDLRVLRDENDRTILLYSFIDRNTLVITSSENIFTALIGKYNVSKQIR